jgi:hypothetical protein
MRLLSSKPLAMGLTVMLVCTFFLSLNVMAQSAQTIKGIIRDNKGAPLAGVNIQVKNTGIITASGTDGSFAVKADKGQTLVITAVNFQEEEVVIGTEETITISL